MPAHRRPHTGVARKITLACAGPTRPLGAGGGYHCHVLTRRQPRISMPVIITFVACLAAIGVLLIVGYTLTLAWAQRSLHASAQRGISTLDQYFSAAETSMRTLEESTRIVTAREAAPLLARAIYRTPLFREAGLIDSQGRLVATSQGPVDPPFIVSRESLAPSSVQRGALYTVGIVTTQVMSLPSLVLAFPAADGRQLNFLMDPLLVTTSLSGIVMDDGAVARVTSAGGVELASMGGNAPAANNSSPTVIADAVSERFGTRIELRAPRAWALRGFTAVAQVLLPVALIGAGLVTFLVALLTSRHRGLDQEIRRGIAGDEFEAHYQPTVEIATGRCIGAEVLMRWNHPQSGYIRPDLFVAAAESSGLIDTLTLAQIKRVLREMTDVIRKHPGLHLGINLTADHLSRDTTPTLLASLFTASTIPAANILLEATERQAMEGDAPKRVMSTLRESGFDIALDDFGTGYSSLAYLSEFKFQYLKIDASFVRRIGKDSINTDVLDAIIGMGRALNVKLIAEGVETAAQARFLHSKGVQYAQGWLYSKALPPADFIAFLLAPPVSVDRLDAAGEDKTMVRRAPGQKVG